MPPARYVRQPKLQATKRSAANASLNIKCDSSLKELRSCSRQLSSILSCLEDELRLLERLYYKGVNQHRSAMFWHKVEEIRRLGARLLEVQLLDLTDGLRYSFYTGSDVEKNPKILKNAWTQIPDVKYIYYALERMRSSVLLASRARERFAGAHHTFELMLQTGAFLQLILILTALVSRLDILISELQMVLQNLDDTLLKLIDALGGKVRSIGKRSGKAQEPLQSTSSATQVREDMKLDELVGEDLGSTVVRRTPSVEPKKALLESPANAPLFWQDTRTMNEDPPDQQVAFTKPSVIVTTAIEPTQTDEAAKKISGSKTVKKIKKKQKRDAIDDIFGSL